jgi:hypothetical protein
MLLERAIRPARVAVAHRGPPVFGRRSSRGGLEIEGARRVRSEPEDEIHD